jgi:hypothetical protein
MTKFADQLFDDLMREHGTSLNQAGLPAAPRRRLASRPVLVTAGAAVVAVGATAGVLASGGGTPAFAVTAHPNGTVTLAVYDKSGYAGINSKLRQDGDSQVVVVPVESGCPIPQTVWVSGDDITMRISSPANGGVTVSTTGVPAGDLLVLGLQPTADGGTFAVPYLTSASDPTPTCIPPAHTSPSPPRSGGGSGSGPSGVYGHKSGKSTQSDG